MWRLLLLSAALSGQKYDVRLRLPPEGLTAQEEMQIEYRVVDTSRVDPVMGPAPVIRARARSVIEMPGMPGMAALTETAHPEGVPGEYGVHPVFPHGGEYRLRLFITPPGAAEFDVTFPLQVADAAKGRRAKPRPYYAEVRMTPRNPKAGEAAELEIVVSSRLAGGGRVREFDTQHERIMHLMIVREDLGSFAHEHPEPAADGTFRLRYVFPDAGEYTLFADAAPKGAGGQVMPVRVKVGGKKRPRFAIGAEPLSREAAAGSVRLSLAETKFPSGRTLRIPCRVSDAKTGAAATGLQPYLGAMGHLILVHEDGETYVHSHPDEGAELAFLARFPKPGRYRGWAQVRRGGVVETGAFLVEAGAP